MFVHYSNLDAALRQDVETRFAAAVVAVCVCTSTLELGIDIGSVDDIVLLGAPPDLTAFMQRVGRGGRRAAHTRVLCMPKSPQEWARFEALLHLVEAPIVDRQLTYAFRPSVLVQQIFSLIKQSPTGSVRLADIRRLAPAEVTSEDIRHIISNLTFSGYLQSGRLGEWKPQVELQEMIDQHEIYSNIGADVRTATAVDAYTGRVIAQTDRLYKKGAVVLFGGRPMSVVWSDKYRFGLAPAKRDRVDEVLRFKRGGVAIPFDVTQAVARSLGLQAGEMAQLPAEQGMWLFHFWGTIWGELLTAVLHDNALNPETVNEYCLYLHQPISELPPWNDTVINRVAKTRAVTLAGRLQMGRFHKLLPAHVAAPAVIKLFNLEAFGQVYRSAKIAPAAQVHAQLAVLTR